MSCTEIAFAGGGDIAGDAVGLFAGVEDAVGRLGRHALGQQRLQPAGRLIEQANFDHVVMQQSWVSRRMFCLSTSIRSSMSMSASCSGVSAASSLAA